MDHVKEQNDKINKLREAKKIVLNEHDILLTEEAEQLYFNALNALNKLVNMEIDTLNEMEK